MRAKNAVLLISPHHCNETDFRRIASRARELAPDVRAYVAIDGRRNRTARWVQLLRPTLAVEIEPVTNYRRLRGPCLAAPLEPKLPLLRRMAAAGLPVPELAELTPDLVLDPARWGPYVVVKPSYGARGAYVRVQRTGAVRYRPPESFPADHPARLGPLIVQRFVHTGPWPVCYRVLTFLGEPIMAARYEGSHELPPVHSPDRFPGGATIVASSKRATITLASEPDLLALARRIAAALPEAPVLGLDLMREAASGALSIAEANRRHCWTLSNQSGKEMQRQFGLDFYAQFDAIERAAEALVRATRALAR